MRLASSTASLTSDYFLGVNGFILQHSNFSWLSQDKNGSSNQSDALLYVIDANAIKWLWEQQEISAHYIELMESKEHLLQNYRHRSSPKQIPAEVRDVSLKIK